MKLFAWLRRSRLDDLSAEIQSHIEEKTDELLARGLSRAEAERAALRAFGDVTRVKERSGDVWRFGSFLENLGSDIRHALRGLIQKPAFTIAVVSTLALGIGANAVVFALVNAIVLRPLPYSHADRLISVANSEGEGKAYTLRDFAYDEWVKSTRSVDLSAAYEQTRAVV
jgi:hypothetical protein